VLVPSDDPDVLAAAVQDLIGKPERRAAMGRAAQRRAREKFSAGAIVPRYEAVYRRVCG
jgi:glycosyltransferase involved in cell wall biosynthesis